MKQWIISQMDTAPTEDGLTDVVKTVHWRRQTQDGEYIADLCGALGCSAPDPMAFTPYDSLTFDDVCSWLEANIDVNELDAQLDIMIEHEKNPPIVQLPLPWVPAPVQESIEETPSNSL